MRKFTSLYLNPHTVRAVCDQMKLGNIEIHSLKADWFLHALQSLHSTMILQETSFSIVPSIQHPLSLRRALRPQIYMASSLFLSTAACCMAIGHSAVLLPEIQSGNSTLVINEDMGSWIASVYSIVGPVGNLLGGLSVEVLGRKKTHIIADICSILGWFLIGFAQNGSMILSARIIQGFATNMQAIANSVLIDELADPRFRGMMLCIIYSSIYVGIITISAFSTFFEWHTAARLATVISFITSIMICFIYESPTWLARMNQIKKAEKILRYLWGPGKELQAEQELIILKTKLQTEHNIPLHQAIVQKITLLSKPHVLKPFLIMHFVNAIQAFCGTNFFAYYAIDILSETTKNGREILDNYYTNIIISGLRTLGTISSCYLVFSLGRRKLAMTSGICSFVPALVVGFLLLPSKVNNDGSDNDVTSINTEAYIIYILIMLYNIGITIGLVIIPGLMIGETQNHKIRGFVCGYIFATNDLILGGVVKLYPWLLATFEIHGIFFMFGISCAVCTVFIYIFIPETQGLTLEQIEDYFQQPNILWITRKKIFSKNVNHKNENCTESPNTLLV